MPHSIHKLIDGNRLWVKEKLEVDPDFFKELSAGQSPEFLWIGCSDSRVPANEITRTRSGDIFVHRNISNMVIHTDISMLSVLDYAVSVLKVRHIIVVGHYCCGGVQAALSNKSFGFIDNWLRHIKDVYNLHSAELDAIENETLRCNRLVELNVMEQVRNLSKTSVIQEAWKSHHLPELHGWVYDVADGVLRNLNVSIRQQEDMGGDIYKYNIPDKTLI